MDPEVNPENTSGAGQNGVGQNPSQNMVGQNVAFPSQSLQPAAFPDQNLQPVQNSFDQNPQSVPNSFAQNPQPIQNPFAQNPSLPTPLATTSLTPSPTPSKSKKPIWIACIVGVLALIIAVVSIVCVVVMRGDNDLVGDATNSDEGSVEGAGPSVAEDVAEVMDMEKFKQMTKAEAMALLEAGRNTGGSMPKNYVGAEITDLIIVENYAMVVSDVSLKYSHETLDDLRQIAEDWYGVLGHNDGITADDYEIKEYDYYAIAIPNRIEGTNTCDSDYYGGCNSLLSFKREYINYYQEETSPHSYNDVAYLNTQNPELAERLLRTYSLFYNYGAASGHGNIYGSSFEEQDDMLVLTVYYVGVGLDMEKFNAGGSDIGYAINLYSRQYAADKADGRLHVIRTGESSTVNNIKSIPITEEELSSLLGYDV